MSVRGVIFRWRNGLREWRNVDVVVGHGGHAYPSLWNISVNVDSKTTRVVTFVVMKNRDGSMEYHEK